MESQTLACRIGAGLSTSGSAWDAATEAAREARGGALGRDEVDLAFIFLSPAHLGASGGGGIRTHEALARPTTFKAVAFDHSATPPGASVLAAVRLGRFQDRPFQPLRHPAGEPV